MYYDEVPCASTEDELESTPVKCVTSDKQEVLVEIGVLRVSKLLNDVLGDKPDPETITIPLPNINSETFKAVVEWCKNHKGAPEPLVETDPVTRERKWFDMTEWEVKFFERYLAIRWDLAMAANYLNIHGLYYYTCQKLAELMKGKNPEEIREMFGIEDDLTEEEKAEIRRTNLHQNQR